MLINNWMVVACMTKVDPKQLKNEGNYSSNEIKIFADVRDSTFSDSIIDVDDEELMKKVKEHWKSVKKESN